MEELNFPVLDFDPTIPAIIEPSEILAKRDVPKQMVFCYFREVVEKLVESGKTKEFFRDRSEDGITPFYEIEYQGRRLGVVQGRVGAPMAVGILEEAIALGVRQFVACGGCGILDPQLAQGHLLIPVRAIRGEGTSYHYAAPSFDIEMQPKAVAVIEKTLKEKSLPYLKAVVWTTDAIYRETVDKVRKYRDKGAIAVEMEAAALMAAAQFRGVDYGQILYGGDRVLESGWDHAHWNSRQEIRENLFWLAADACLKMGENNA